VGIARRLEMTAEEVDEVARAAELHDVGKVGVPDAILDKPGHLDPGEWEFMRQHTILGERILNAAPALRPVARLVRSSHERWDGTGYPDRLKGAEIPRGSRIVAVCDAYEAMTTHRAYRSAFSPADALNELRCGAGTQFDPKSCRRFSTSSTTAGPWRARPRPPHCCTTSPAASEPFSPKPRHSTENSPIDTLSVSCRHGVDTISGGIGRRCFSRCARSPSPAGDLR
jgi:hypothetical protein